MSPLTEVMCTPTMWRCTWPPFLFPQCLLPNTTAIPPFTRPPSGTKPRAPTSGSSLPPIARLLDQASTPRGKWISSIARTGSHQDRTVCAAVCGPFAQQAIAFDRQEDSYDTWHEGCRRGEHDHPAEPTSFAPTQVTGNLERVPDLAMNSSQSTFAPFELDDEGADAGSLSLANLHFAVRGGEVIYGDADAALDQYRRVAARQSAAELIATESYLKALFFARGVSLTAAETLAAERAHQSRSARPPSQCPVATGSMAAPITPVRALRPSSFSTPSSSPNAPRATAHAASRSVLRANPSKSANTSTPRANALSRAPTDEVKERARRARLAAIQLAIQHSTTSAPAPVNVKGKGRQAAEEYESDVDEEFAKLVEQWVPVEEGQFDGSVPKEERFDPRFENRPHDDA